MPKLIDLTGKRFGRLVVKGYVGGGAWLCVCDCGTKLNVIGQSLRDGRTTSCKCLWRERMAEVHTKHGRAGKNDTVYQTWKGMKDRCCNPKNAHWHNYGGRGIKVCLRWRRSFKAFFDDFGKHWPGKGYSIDRINNDGDYEPGNVRWATAHEQAANTRQTHRLTHDGRTQPATQWAKEWKLPVETVCWWVRKYGPKEAVLRALARLAKGKS